VRQASPFRAGMDKFKNLLVKIFTIMHKFKNLLYDLIPRYPGRELEILSCISGILIEEPVLLIGPPGTAKTSIIDEISNKLGLKFFRILLTKFTQPEEVFGPFDITALREGKLKRVTDGKLPEANIAFFDEVWYASSAIRNSLLDVIEKRRFEGIPIDLVTIFGASNFMSQDREDMAFADRFTFRIFMDVPLSPRLWEKIMMKAIDLSEERITGTQFQRYNTSLDEIRKIHLEVIRDSRKAFDTLKDKISDILLELISKGIFISDRRKFKILPATVIINKMLGLEIDNKIGLSLAIKFVSPTSQDDIEVINKVLISNKLTPYEDLIVKVTNLITEVMNVIKEFDEKVKQNVIQPEITQALKSYLEQINNLFNILTNDPLTKIGINNDMLYELERIKLEIEKRLDIIRQKLGV